MDFDAITGLKADALALQQLAELTERLAAREDLDVIRVEARLLVFDRRRARCLREESDAFAQSSALLREAHYPKSVTLRAVTPKKEIFYARPPQSATGRERDSGSNFEVAITRYVIATLRLRVARSVSYRIGSNLY